MFDGWDTALAHMFAQLGPVQLRDRIGSLPYNSENVPYIGQMR